ncbi:MAG TPA: NAD-dependent epimerase/dehydratase family protein [Patescibacteria group bacterium]|nr:NAD-dependent epimerase/dehydratase family protein [Patescibacteria group bacterium]
MQKTKIVLTGGAGFVASHCVEHYLKNTDYDIIILDKLNYASNGFDRLRDIKAFDDKRVKLFAVDLQQPITVGVAQEIGEVDYILNLASESHVDRSIDDPVNFIQNNVNLMLNMLEWAKTLKGLKKFIQFSTDEAYGTAPDGVAYKEGDRHNVGNPYSASKDCQEAICRAYSNTYGLPINITNAMNIIGERQHPEKFVPICIRKILNDEVIQIHASADLKESGTRHYLHARNIAQALQFILEKTNERLDKVDASLGCWNIVGDVEIANSNLAKMIGKILGKEAKIEMISFHSSRPGHDLAYRLSGEKLKKAGFEYPKSFEETLKKIVEWDIAPENKRWLGL